MNIGLDARYVQSGFPGIGRYVYNLAESVAEILSVERSNSQLNLVYNPAIAPKRHDVASLAQNYPGNVRLLPTSARPISVQEQLKLPVLARSQNLKLWHAPYYIRPYLMPLPSVLTVYDVTSTRLPDSLPSKKARLAYEITTRLAFATSRRIITISHATANDIIQLYRVKPQKIKVIPLGVDAQFKPATPAEKEQIKIDLRLPSSYILYVGINKPHKNLVRLLEAFKQFQARTEAQTTLIIAGPEDPRYSAALHAHANQLGFDPAKGQDVRFWGEVAEADLQKLYAAADFLVMPSLYEGFGLPVLEAMASGCPIACSDNSSLPEVAGDCAITFDPTQTAQIANAIEQMWRQSSLRADLRLKGLQRAGIFSWKHVAAQTLEVYDTLN